MELKTLKDLDKVTINAVGHTNNNELRQEAIKWIKELKLEENPTPFTAIMPSPSYEGVIKFLLYFFNITKEELE